MNILCVNPGYELYGADRSFARTVYTLRTRFPKARIKVVLPRKGPILDLPPLGEIDREIRPLWIFRRRTFLRGFTRDIRQSILALRSAYRDMRSADLVYINTIIVFDYIVMSRFIAKPVIVHVREIPNGIELFIFKKLLLWSRASLIFNSDATRNAFRLPGPVVYNGVDIPELSEQGQAKEQKVKVLMIGRLNHWKGQEVLIEAVGLLTPTERAGLRVRIVGGTFNNQDVFRERLARMIEDKQLGEVVKLDQFEPDPSSSYRDADLVVVPSRLPEPFGRVAIEAMGFSKPVVASRHGGLTEIVRDGETGRLFTPGSSAELCGVLREFLANRDTYRSFGLAGRRRFEGLFTTEQSSKAFVAAINGFLFSDKPALHVGLDV